jgi:hypothetical protein
MAVLDAVVCDIGNGSGRYRQRRAVIYAAEECHVSLTTEKIRALVDNIGGNENRGIAMVKS